MIKTVHALIKINTKNSNNLTNVEVGTKLLEDISNLIGTKVVDSSFHEFGPRGITGVLLLQESHISIHTWPEHQFAIIDLLSCKDLPEKFEESVETLIGEIFEISQFEIKVEQV